MTWASAKQDADRMIQVLIQDIGEDRLAGMSVNLALYSSQDTLDMMQPANTWPLAHHQMVTRSVKREMIRRYKSRVTLLPVTLADYQRWLGERDNTPQARAEYLSWRKT